MQEDGRIKVLTYICRKDNTNVTRTVKCKEVVSWGKKWLKSISIQDRVIMDTSIRFHGIKEIVAFGRT